MGMMGSLSTHRARLGNAATYSIAMTDEVDDVLNSRHGMENRNATSVRIGPAHAAGEGLWTEVEFEDVE
eukprot:1040353-Amphidinium_carterae.1